MFIMVADDVNVTVRPFRKTDLNAALSLAGTLITSEEITSLNPGDPGSFCFVAEVDKKIVGFNLARELYVGIPLSRICVIQGIVVHDDYRRLGIGEKLIEAVCELCEGHDIEAIRTLVDENDIRLRRFVEHLGFRRSAVANYDKAIGSF